MALGSALCRQNAEWGRSSTQKSATIDWHHLECAEDFDTTGWCLRTYRTFGQIERASPIGRVWIVGCTSRPLSAAHHLQIESIHIRF